jgi:hypothetical protein
MIANEVAIAAGALAAAVLDGLIAKQLLTRDEAAYTLANAMARVPGIRNTGDKDAARILSDIASHIATGR